MQSNQKIWMSTFFAMSIHYCIQDYITFMVSGDILMVLFFNCTSIMINFMAQMHLDYLEIGFAGIVNKTETHTVGVLNQTSFICLTSSIIQMLVLLCIYYWVLWEKEKNLKTELIEAFEEIMAKMNASKKGGNPIGVVITKYYHSNQVQEVKQKSRFLDGWS